MGVCIGKWEKDIDDGDREINELLDSGLTQ